MSKFFVKGSRQTFILPEKVMADAFLKVIDGQLKDISVRIASQNLDFLPTSRLLRVVITFEDDSEERPIPIFPDKLPRIHRGPLSIWIAMFTIGADSAQRKIKALLFSIEEFSAAFVFRY